MKEPTLKILLLAIDIDLRRNRGDSTHTRELARSLGERGNVVVLVTATPEESVHLGPNVKHHRSPAGSDLTIVRFCTRLAMATGTDIVYERRLSPKIAFGVSRLSGLPFVVEINGIEGESGATPRLPSRLSAPIKQKIRSRMMRQASAIVSVTDRLAALTWEQHGLQPQVVKTVPNGVDQVMFRPMRAPDARRILGLQDAEWVVFVGNLVSWQGLETLLLAMPRVVRDSPHARLAIIGDGPLRTTLEDLAIRYGIHEVVSFRGSVPHVDVPLWINAASVCVAPFARLRNQTTGVSPLKLYEYLACGRPVVASDVPGIREVLEASGAGIAVPPGEPEALADAIITVLSDGDLAAGMGLRGRKYAVAECSWARVADRVESVLRKAVESAI